MATTASAQGLLNSLDIDSAIGEFTVIIDQIHSSKPTLEDYFGRGTARCFNLVKRDELYTGAIEDLSVAHALDPKKTEILYYWAYAYYANKFYDRAIDDCKKAIGSATDTAPFDELMGHSHFALKKYKEAKDNYGNVIKGLLKDNKLVPSSLLDKYREACEKEKV